MDNYQSSWKERRKINKQEQKCITAITVRSSEILSTLAVVMGPEIMANTSIQTFTAAAWSYICSWTTIKYTQKNISFYSIYS